MTFNTTILDSKLSESNQDVTMVRLYGVKIVEQLAEMKITTTHRLKIIIKSDAYGQQCFALCKIYSRDENKWNSLCDIPYSNMHTQKGLVFSNATSLTQFVGDETELLRLAELILT